MEGFLLVDKPLGKSSFWPIRVLRRITGVARIGHAGTLDPFATGLLVIGVGRTATRLLGTLTGHDKEYVAEAVFGATTDTQDVTGIVMPFPNVIEPDETTVRAALAAMVGPQQQLPPMYSAKQINGQRLYDLARAGQVVERQPRTIVVHEIEMLAYVYPRLKFRVACGAGTYVRTLAHDLGERLGCGAYLEGLRRTRSGDFRIEDALPLDDFTKENWENRIIPVASLPKNEIDISGPQA
jgi:tRNA pseudouridine55 synthase